MRGDVQGYPRVAWVGRMVCHIPATVGVSGSHSSKVRRRSAGSEWLQTSKSAPGSPALMAGNWPPPEFNPGDKDGNLSLWRAWLPGNYRNHLSLQATTSVPWCQVGAMRVICDGADAGNLSPEGALQLLRWCVRTSRGDVKWTNSNSRVRLGMADVLDLAAPELQGARSDDDVIRVLLTHVGGCYPIAELLEK